MIERLLDYKNKCRVLKQIQSNKALLFRRINNIQNLITIVISGVITFIGFSGFETIYATLVPLFDSVSICITIQGIQRGYNFLVFLLFIVVIVHMVFNFNGKQAAAERAIPLLSGLINEIDDLIEDGRCSSITSITDKYLLIIQMIPANTDKEYLKAKQTLAAKSNNTRVVEKHSLFTAGRKEQEAYVTKLIQNNDVVQSILKTLKKQDEELYLGGGVVRNIVWDHLHNYSAMTPIDDVDVIYFDSENTTKDHDVAIQKRLQAAMPNFTWSVKNQARMHAINDDQPYVSLSDAVTKWPETASAMLIREDKDGDFIIIAPFGFNDLLRLIVRPTPHFMHKIDKYRARILAHGWQEKWRNLEILYMDQPDNITPGT